MKARMLMVLALLAFGAGACGVSDNAACHSSARAIAACSMGVLMQSTLDMACDNPSGSDGGMAMRCTNMGDVNAALQSCANAVPASPSMSDCQTYATCASNATNRCMH